MEDRPIYVIEQDDGVLTVEEPPVALDGGRVVYCCGGVSVPTWPTDPALAWDLETLRGVARAAGAAEMAVLRRVEDPDVYWRRDGRFGRLRGADAGTLVLIRFAADDGVARPCEQWEFSQEVGCEL
jgi:hypothetical protein